MWFVHCALQPSHLITSRQPLSRDAETDNPDDDLWRTQPFVVSFSPQKKKYFFSDWAYSDGFAERIATTTKNVVGYSRNLKPQEPQRVVMFSWCELVIFCLLSPRIQFCCQYSRVCRPWPLCSKNPKGPINNGNGDQRNFVLVIAPLVVERIRPWWAGLGRYGALRGRSLRLLIIPILAFFLKRCAYFFLNLF